jgi:hypothetical protein
VQRLGLSYAAELLVFYLRQGKYYFKFIHGVQVDFMSYNASCLMDKVPERQVYSPTCIAEVNNAWHYILTDPVAFIFWFSVKQEQNLSIKFRN